MEGVLRCRAPPVKNGLPRAVSLFVRSSFGIVSYVGGMSSCTGCSQALVRSRLMCCKGDHACRFLNIGKKSMLANNLKIGN